MFENPTSPTTFTGDKLKPFFLISGIRQVSVNLGSDNKAWALALKQQTMCLPQSEGWESETSVQCGQALVRALFWAAFWL